MKRKKPARRELALDGRDRALLAALARDAWLGYAQLGEAANLSPSAAQRRVEKLVAAGIIEGAEARIAPAALGRPLRLYILVDLHDEANGTLSTFARRMSGNPAVVEAHYVAGAADILIVMQAESMAEYADFAEHQLNSNPSVKRYRTLTSLRPLR